MKSVYLRDQRAIGECGDGYIMQTAVQIKPHHFLDIIRDFGAGMTFAPHVYGHAVHTVAEKVLSDRNIALQLVLGCDDICRPCINNEEGRCIDSVDHPPFTSKEEWNRTIDTRISEKLGLEEGTEIAASEFCRITREKIGDLYDIWREVPRGYTDLRRQNLMKGISMYLGENG
jgi:hypothetical protein